jgi:transcriptional regulator
MYIPKIYREEDSKKIVEFLKRNNFPALVSYDGEKPLATHIVVDVTESEGGLIIYGHMSRANPQWETLQGQEALLIFQGAHTYISPRWYSQVNVPTWDYMMAHVYGKAREIAGSELYSALSRLVQNHEINTSYRLEGLPQDFLQREMNGIVGFAIAVTRVEASYKLSQNRTDQDRENIARELDQRGDEYSMEIAQAIRQNSRGAA